MCYKLDEPQNELGDQFISLWQKELSTLGLNFDQINKSDPYDVREVEFLANDSTPKATLLFSSKDLFEPFSGYPEGTLSLVLPFPQSSILLSQVEDVEKLQRSFLQT